jgi:hypothetical protein
MELVAGFQTREGEEILSECKKTCLGWAKAYFARAHRQINQ